MKGQQLGLSAVSTEESDWKTGAVEDTILYKKAEFGKYQSKNARCSSDVSVSGS